MHLRDVSSTPPFECRDSSYGGCSGRPVDTVRRGLAHGKPQNWAVCAFLLGFENIPNRVPTRNRTSLSSWETSCNYPAGLFGNKRPSGRPQRSNARSQVAQRSHYGCDSKFKSQGYAGFGLCFHLPRGHFGDSIFLSHSQNLIAGWPEEAQSCARPAMRFAGCPHCRRREVWCICCREGEF